MKNLREAYIGDGSLRITSDGRAFTNRMAGNHRASTVGEWHEVCTNNPKVKSRYKTVCVVEKDGSKHHEYLHRLIATHFVDNPNPAEFNVVNHINANKWDNRAENLEWTDSMGNSKAAVELGLFDKEFTCKYCGKTFTNYIKPRPLCPDCVQTYKTLRELYQRKDYESQNATKSKAKAARVSCKKIAKAVGCDLTTVTRWMNGESWLSTKYYWKIANYIDEEYERRFGQ